MDVKVFQENETKILEIEKELQENCPDFMQYVQERVEREHDASFGTAEGNAPPKLPIWTQHEAGKLKEALQLRGYSLKTIKAYSGQIARFLDNQLDLGIANCRRRPFHLFDPKKKPSFLQC